MKNILSILLISVILLGCRNNPVSLEDLFPIYDVYHYDGDPYTGKVIDYFDNGQLGYEYNFKNGKREGLSKMYFENGQVKKVGEFSDGILLYEECWDDNGNEIECEKKKNSNQLSCEELTNKGGEGDPRDLIMYYKGKLFSGTCVDGNDEMRFKDGKVDGLIKTYYDNGQLNTVLSYENGVQHGLSKIYYKNGQLKMKLNVDSELDLGVGELYYENGQLMRKTKKEKGVYTYKICWDENGNEIDCD